MSKYTYKLINVNNHIWQAEITNVEESYVVDVIKANTKREAIKKAVKLVAIFEKKS